MTFLFRDSYVFVEPVLEWAFHFFFLGSEQEALTEKCNAGKNNRDGRFIVYVAAACGVTAHLY